MASNLGHTSGVRVTWSLFLMQRCRGATPQIRHAPGKEAERAVLCGSVIALIRSAMKAQRIPFACPSNGKDCSTEFAFIAPDDIVFQTSRAPQLYTFAFLFGRTSFPGDCGYGERNKATQIPL